MPRPRPRSVALTLLVWFAAACATAPWNPAGRPLPPGAEVEIRWRGAAELRLSLPDSTWTVPRPSSATGRVVDVREGRMALQVLRLSTASRQRRYQEPGPTAVVPLDEVRVYVLSEHPEEINRAFKADVGAVLIMGAVFIVWLAYAFSGD